MQGICETTGREPRVALAGKCPVCEAAGSVPLFRRSDRLHDTPGVFEYRRCRACHTVFQDPRVVPEDLGLCYPHDYYTHEEPELPPLPISDRSRVLGTFRDALRQGIVAAVQGCPNPTLIGLLGRALSLSRIMRQRAFYGHLMDELLPGECHRRRALEIGCGSGWNLVAMARAGWSVEGVEWDPVAAEVARRVSGAQVWQGDFCQLRLTENAYDLVVLIHVLEHLTDPLLGLRRIGRLLAPAGRMVLVYPNPNSLGARVFGGHWYGWDSPRHLSFPSSAAVCRVARASGLKLVHWRTRPDPAAQIFAASRVMQAGRKPRASDSDPTGRDRLWALLERALVLLGFPVGEEIVVTLERNR